MPTQTPQNKQPKPGNNWGRLSKTISFWILVILIPVALLQLSGGRSDQAPSISYTQYNNELSRDNIKDITITGGKTGTGDFNQPVTVERATGKQVHRALSGGEFGSGGDQAQRQERQHQGGGRAAVDLPDHHDGCAVAVVHRDLHLLLPPDAGGGQQGVLVRQVEGQAAHRRHAQGDVCRRGGRGRSQGGAAGDHRVPARSAKVHHVWAGACPRARCSWALRARARRCSRARWPARPPGRSSRCRAPTSWRCSWAWARPGCATYSNRERLMRPASSSSTRSTPWGGIAAPAWAADTTSGSRRSTSSSSRWTASSRTTA